MSARNHDAIRFDPETSGSRVGLDLRAARERAGWTLAAVAEHLRIRLPYLLAIEEGRASELPGPAYAIGFVRAYAKAVGLDQDEISRRFRAEAGEVAKPELSFPAPVPDRGVPALAVVAVGALLVVGAYAAWYRMSGDQRPGPETVQTVPERLAPLAVTPPPSGEAPPAPPAPAPTQMASLPPAAVPQPSVSPSSAAAMTPPPPTTDASHIVVRAKSDAWIQVKDSKGAVILNRVLRGGETWPVPPRIGTTQQALLLTTGNAGGTELLVDGIPAASLGVDGAVRRDLPLDPEAIRDGRLTAAAPTTRFSPHNQ